MGFNLKIISFPLRIALLSASLAGSALIGFGFASWLLIYKTKVDALDAEIKSQLLANMTRPPRFNNTLQRSTALLVIDRDGETLYQSNNWPSDLNSTIVCSPQSELNCQPFPLLLPPRQQQQFPIPNQLLPLPPPMKRSQVSTKQNTRKFGELV
jgi:hypothetical protein